MYWWTEEITTLWKVCKVKQRKKIRANKNNHVSQEDKNRLHEKYKEVRRKTATNNYAKKSIWDDGYKIVLKKLFFTTQDDRKIISSHLNNKEILVGKDSVMKMASGVHRNRF